MEKTRSTNRRAIRIGVSARASARLGDRLLRALESAFPIELVDSDAAATEGCAGLLAFVEDQDLIARCAQQGIGGYILDLRADPIRTGEKVLVRLSDSRRLDARLRSRTLTDCKHVSVRPLRPEAGDVVVATAGDSTVWVIRERDGARYHVAAVEPGPLPDSEVLWRSFNRGRFLGLLPLLHYLRDVTASLEWKPPPLRACIVVDDPNLHGLSFGYVDFRRLADHAEKHDYHVSFATVPIDGWRCSGGARKLFRERAARLSLTMHGVYHAAAEMEQRLPTREGVAYIQEGIDRIRRFERRHEVPISKVMIAPHGSVSREMLEAMAKTDLDGICISGKPYPHLAEPPPEDVLAGWNMATFMEGAFPVILRDSLATIQRDGPPWTRQDQVLKSYLNQPMVFSAHHGDFKKGLANLEDLAGFVNSLGDVQWGSLDSIMRSNYATRRQGDEFEIEMHTRKARVHVPEGISHVSVDVSRFRALEGAGLLFNGARAPEPISVEGGLIRLSNAQPGELEISLDIPVPDSSAPHPSRALLWLGLSRRLLCEVRDRIRPMLGV